MLYIAWVAFLWIWVRNYFPKEVFWETFWRLFGDPVRTIWAQCWNNVWVNCVQENWELSNGKPVIKICNNPHLKDGEWLFLPVSFCLCFGVCLRCFGDCFVVAMSVLWLLWSLLWLFRFCSGSFVFALVFAFVDLSSRRFFGFVALFLLCYLVRLLSFRVGRPYLLLW